MPIRPSTGSAQPAVSAPRPAASGTLKLGSRGPRVAELQTTLRRLGYYAGEASGKFDKATLEAVADFQTANELDNDGVAGPATLKALARIAKTYLPADNLNLAAKPEPTPEVAAQEQDTLKVTKAWLSPQRPSTDEGGMVGRRVESDSLPLGFDELKWPANQKRLANLPLVKRKLDMLEGSQLVSAEERKQYEAVANKLAEGKAHGALAWQSLLLEQPERVLKGAKNRAGETTLQVLSRLASGEAPLHEKIARDELLEHLVVELAVPTSIDQRSWGTCAATTVQLRLVHEAPAEYVGLVVALASPEGKATLPDGTEVTREPGTENPDSRTIPTRLVTPMLMELGNGPDADYDNATDQHSDSKDSGLGSEQLNRVERALRRQEMQTFYPSRETIESIMGRIEKTLAAGGNQPVALEWGARDAAGKVHGAHEVLVTGIREQRVYYDNPWGTEESMAIEEFKKRVLFINQPAESAPSVPAEPAKKDAPTS